ncbi:MULTISPECIES: Gfo/Idh/MocA family oxidoreductase [unclassified Pseudonocardia]|uniref:Gfo/Idh/MocA family protein n=1 Tax=unclassified Pseudonocardia TaxID=2619320 RepID=UPI0001FFE018|nr:Gfo/Idh/MocA family oxidoreductase [Pseudonocardia sp. Ae707_Ps1]OLM18822.1 Myo-inositol 2-dehydrogenase [Pseudonocardia sp. Ae707_Ps1]
MSEELRVAVVGVGKMGAFHVDSLSRRVRGARVTVVSDADADRAAEVAAVAGARIEPDPVTAIGASDVDAVVLASPGAAHEKQVLACLDAGKPVLCEKPLTMDEPSAHAVVRAEAATGRRLIQVGFMRRFDAEYARLREMVTGGELGDPLMLHCVHRNPAVPEHFTSVFAMADSVVHEVDCTRFLLGEEITAVTVLKPAATSSSPAGNADPMLVLFETESGRLVDVESFVRTGVAYEVRTELVAEHGMATIGLDQNLLLRRAGRWGGEIAPDFVVRFGQAYDSQMQAFVDAAAQGTVTGPGAWDGYAAVAVCAAGVEAVTSGKRVEVRLGEKP